MALTEIEELAIRKALFDTFHKSGTQIASSIRIAEKIYAEHMVDRPNIESLIITGFLLEQIRRNFPARDEEFLKMVEVVCSACIETVKEITRREKEKAH